MVRSYLPTLLQLLSAGAFAAITLGLSAWLGGFAVRRARKLHGTPGAAATAARDSAYECGLPAEGGPPPRFAVKFYLAAALFVIFDVEAALFYPWAASFRDLAASGAGAAAFFSILAFAVILLVPFIFAIRRGALDFND